MVGEQVKERSATHHLPERFPVCRIGNVQSLEAFYVDIKALFRI